MEGAKLSGSNDFGKDAVARNGKTEGKDLGNGAAKEQLQTKDVDLKQTDKHAKKEDGKSAGKVEKKIDEKNVKEAS